MTCQQYDQAGLSSYQCIPSWLFKVQSFYCYASHVFSCSEEALYKLEVFIEPGSALLKHGGKPTMTCTQVVHSDKLTIDSTPKVPIVTAGTFVVTQRRIHIHIIV